MSDQVENLKDRFSHFTTKITFNLPIGFAFLEFLDRYKLSVDTRLMIRWRPVGSRNILWIFSSPALKISTPEKKYDFFGLSSLRSVKNIQRIKKYTFRAIFLTMF